MDTPLPTQVSKFLKQEDLDLLKKLTSDPSTTRRELLNRQLVVLTSLFNLMHERAHLCDTGHPENMSLAVRLAMQLQNQSLAVLRALERLPAVTTVERPATPRGELRTVPLRLARMA